MYRGILSPPAPPGNAGQFDVIGASQGVDLGNINPDAQSFLLRTLAAHLDKLNAVLLTNAQAPAEQVEFEVDNANIPAGGLSLHLPSGMGIVSYYVENNSNATLSVFTGLSAAGRTLNSVAPLSWKTALAPQGITSIVITSSSAVLTGTVRLLITSTTLGPAIGSTAGITTAPPSQTVTVTTPTATTTPTQILAANPSRVGLSVYNNNGTSSGGIGLGSSTFAAPIATFGTYVPAVNWKGSVWAFTLSGTAPLVVSEFS